VLQKTTSLKKRQIPLQLNKTQVSPIHNPCLTDLNRRDRKHVPHNIQTATILIHRSFFLQQQNNTSTTVLNQKNPQRQEILPKTAIYFLTDAASLCRPSFAACFFHVAQAKPQP
jgi:hypothetical protein